MKHYRLILLLTGVFLFLSTTETVLRPEERAAAGRQMVRIGLFMLPPFMMTDANGEPGGVTVDFWRDYLAPRMDIDIEVSGPYPIPRLEIMLEKGEIDVIPYITKIPDRASRFIYSSVPLTNIASCIVVRNDSPHTSITAQKDLFGMKIGFITSAFIPSFVKHEQIELELVTTTEFREINHRKLMSGRLDALLDINYLSLVYEMNVRGYSKDIRIIPLEDDRISIYGIFTRSPRGETLRTRYDSIMKDLPPEVFNGYTNHYLEDN